MSNHILVTGAHRSGSTFIGKVLALHNSVGYVSEPFNNRNGLKQFDRWFMYVSDSVDRQNNRKYSRTIENLLNGRARFKRIPLFEGKLDPVHLIGRMLYGNRANYDFSQLTKHNVKRYLLKDPIACMSSEWLHSEYNVDVVVIFRHPAAFAGSLKRLGWTFDFSTFQDQRELMDTYLRNVLPADRTIEDLNELSPLEQGVILWNCIYYVLDQYVKRNPQFIVVRHEDISESPLEEFERLYQRLDIPYTEEIKESIVKWTSPTNPTDPKNNKTHVLQRNSKENAKRWKSILTESEIAFIKENTLPFSEHYYTSSDW